MLNNKSILITGGSGSLGKKLVELILQRYKPARLIVFSRDELKQFEMRERFPDTGESPVRYFLGDVRDKDRLYRAFDGVDMVIHAAALKQVPAAEYNPLECIKTNIMGAVNVIGAAIDCNVDKVIALSTDKASNPINLYGATKLCSDKLFVAARTYSGQHKTSFGVVRYGNVLGSRGSVIPFFRKRRETGVIPITDRRMTRFWITLEQSAEFVLDCLEVQQGGEIFIPKIPSMNIVDLAKAIAPECKIDIIGIRPGEKLHETLIPEDYSRKVWEYEDYYVMEPPHHERMSDPVWHGATLCPDGFEYRSDNNKVWLNESQLQELIKRID